MSLSERICLAEIVTNPHPDQFKTKWFEYLAPEDVKEAVKKLKDKWKMMEYSDLPNENTNQRIDDILKEIFGEKLI